MLTLNTTGGVPAGFLMTGPNSKPGQGPAQLQDFNITVPMHVFSNENMNAFPPLLNSFSLVNRWTWEAGRGLRDTFWKARGCKTPQ